MILKIQNIGLALLMTASTSLFAKKNIVGYYPTWKAHKYTATDVAWDKITELDYSFFAPGPNGKLHVTGAAVGEEGQQKFIDNELLFGPISSKGQKKCVSNIDLKDKITKQCTFHKKDAQKASLIQIAHSNNVKVFASIGGWTMTKYFYSIAKDPVKLNTFNQEVVRLFDEYGFDGIDLDWEYPGTNGHLPDLASKEDKANFVKLTNSLRKTLDNYKSKTGKDVGMTAAVPCSAWRLGEGYNVPQLIKNLDYFNLMAYDLHGPWEEKFGHNSPLYGVNDKDQMSASGCVELWLNAGVPKSQMNMGLAFYGRSWSGPKKADSKTWSDGGGPSYHEVVKKKQMLNIMWDDRAKVPYATYTVDGKKAQVGYENPRSIAIKARFVKDKDLAGVLIWEITQDKLTDGSQPMLDSLNTNLN